MRGSADLVMLVHLCPGPDSHPVRLLDAAVLDQRLGRRLCVRPHALLERAAKLGVVRLADEVVALVVESGVEEELLVLESKCLFSSRMPPFRRVSSCSPSASARTVTAHSLNATGIDLLTVADAGIRDSSRASPPGPGRAT